MQEKPCTKIIVVLFLKVKSNFNVDLICPNNGKKDDYTFELSKMLYEYPPLNYFDTSILAVNKGVYLYPALLKENMCLNLQSLPNIYLVFTHN